MIPIITDYIKKNEKSKNIKGYEDLYELCNHIDCKSINSGDPVDFKCLDDFCKKYATIFREQFLINKSEDEIKHGGTINNPYSKLMLSEELELLEYNYKNVNIEKLLEDSFKFYNNIPIKAISYEPPSHTQEMRISSPLYPTGNAFNQSTIAVATGGSVNLLNVIIIVCVLLLMFVVYIRINSVRVSTVNINQLPILYET